MQACIMYTDASYVSEILDASTVLLPCMLSACCSFQYCAAASAADEAAGLTCWCISPPAAMLWALPAVACPATGASPVQHQDSGSMASTALYSSVHFIDVLTAAI